ncbi:MFS transporter [Streptomyces venezuelae]|uniref:MFS transporter n=1 Tax=Streptomyces venezuelae TaxID=54571 RepID=UPI00123999EC|nr:MFS transporter [Streptomyces venezuelae]QES09109.1 MFS transporter [Streptomyces venezuelae]
MVKARSNTFRSLSVRNFRLFAAGQVVSVAGTWTMVVAQDWLVLGMTGDSGTALGAVTALQFAPMLVLTLYGGRLADRYDKRMLLTVANLTAGALAAVLAVLVLTGGVRLWHIWLLALGIGVVNAVEVPTRMSFVGELVGNELLPNASALSAAYFSVARVAGPALAGLLITGFGTGWAIALNAVSYLATVAGLRMMRPEENPGGARGERPEAGQGARKKERKEARVVDGLRYTASRADLTLPMALVAVIGLCGMNFQLTLPLLAKTVFHADATSFGLLTTAFAAGSLLGAIAGTRRSGRPAARTVIGSALAFGALETAAGWAPGFLFAVVLLTLTGFASIYFAQAANHRIQLGSDPAYRGRILALYTLILQGSTPLGALLVGLLTERLGARAGLWLGGLVSLAAALVALGLEYRGTRPARTAAAPDLSRDPDADSPDPDSDSDSRERLVRDAAPEGRGR